VGTYRALHSVYQPREKGHDLFLRAGSKLELPDGDDTDQLLEYKAIEPWDKDEPASELQDMAEVADQENQDELDRLREVAAERPSANASTSDWRIYAEDRVGIEDLPANAKREDIVAAVDSRMAILNEK
jgi:hypothetical protein